MAIFLGIDGGGSKTACVIGDEDRVLGEGTGGASNLVRVDEAQAQSSLRSAIEQACRQANVSTKQISRTCMGAAGAGRSQIGETSRRLLRELIAGEIEVVGDMVIARDAAFGTRPGVVVIAGTGSIAYGMNEIGECARAGGRGFAISDEGSGYWIGRTAVSALLWAFDRDAKTTAESPLFKSVSKAWGVSSADEVVMAANASPGPDFSRLFPAVLQAAEDGDAIAHEVLQQAGCMLASLAESLTEQIFAHAEQVAAAMCGGVFRHSFSVREAFCRSLQQADGRVQIRPEIVDPVHGALLRARRAAAV